MTKKNWIKDGFSNYFVCFETCQWCLNAHFQLMDAYHQFFRCFFEKKILINSSLTGIPAVNFRLWTENCRKYMTTTNISSKSKHKSVDTCFWFYCKKMALNQIDRDKLREIAGKKTEWKNAMPRDKARTWEGKRTSIK